MNLRNTPCFCGSKKKYKHCCMNKKMPWEEEFRSQIYAKELEKDIKYSKKKGKEFGLFKKLIKGE